MKDKIGFKKDTNKMDSFNIEDKIDALLKSSVNYWEDANQEGLLPGCRALPDCPPAVELAKAGQPAYERLIDIINKEEADSLHFKNCLFCLLYFDNLFVYRRLKEIYKNADKAQKKWLDEACRKIITRCFEYPQERTESLQREIPRNTSRGRLSTTSMIIDLALRISNKNKKKVIIRDTAIADGITTLDMAMKAVEQKIPVSITATDILLYLYFGKLEGNRVVFTSDGVAVQYEIRGEIYRAGNNNLPVCHKNIQKKLNRIFDQTKLDRITMLSSEVELSGYNILFKEEDVFNPEPDIAEADIIRVANILVEKTDDHRGYFYREDIIKAIANLGRYAKDGSYLVLNNFRKKMEHVGMWKKELSSNKWIRLSIPDGMKDDLEGIGDIDIVELSANG
jgi:hypothetical protein